MRIPPLRRNGDGRAFVYSKTIPNKSKRLYLGKYGTADCKRKYEQFVRKYLAAMNKNEPEPVTEDANLTIYEIVEKYLDHAESYYRDDHGDPTSTWNIVLVSARYLCEYCGDDFANNFGPNALRSFQKHLIGEDHSRRYINDIVDVIKRMFKWCQSRELLERGHYEDLRTVSNLRKGRTEARETIPIKPVSLETASKIFPHVSPIVADMMRVQYFCGMRPQDVTRIRKQDIDTSGDIWLYRPEHHKTKHLEKDLVKGIPRVVQDTLQRYLGLYPVGYLFRPVDSDIHYGRTGTRRGDRYNTGSYRQAVKRGVIKHNETMSEQQNGEAIPLFTPNQLRHAAGTDVDQWLGRQASQRWLGHAKMDTTGIYVEQTVEEIITIGRELDRLWSVQNEPVRA